MFDYHWSSNLFHNKFWWNISTPVIPGPCSHVLSLPFNKSIDLNFELCLCDTLSRIWRKQKSHKSNHTVKTNYDCYFIFSLKNWCCCQYPHACRTMVWNYQLKHNPNRDFLYLLMTKSGIERGKAKWRIAWASVQILSVFLFVCGAGICLPCYFIKILMQSMLRSSILFHSHVVQILHIVLKHITQI